MSPSTSYHNAGHETLAVMDEDLEHLCNPLQAIEGGPSWHQVMDCSTPTMYYQAWSCDPELIFCFCQIDTKDIVILTMFKLLSSACNLLLLFFRLVLHNIEVEHYMRMLHLN